MAQGCGVTQNLLLQDNKSSILLERNGKASSGKQTRHINVRNFFITDGSTLRRLGLNGAPPRKWWLISWLSPFREIILKWFLRLHTHPKLLAHQCEAHIKCLNHFICSGGAYGTISNPLPSPLLIQILTVGWKLGSLLGYKPYHYAVVEAPYPYKAACTSMWSTYKVFEPLHMQWMGIWNHQQPVTITLVDPDFDSRLKAWVTVGLQTIPLCSGWGSIPIQSCLYINVEHI